MKNLLLVGGDGSLGRTISKQFAKNGMWNIFSIGYNSNLQAIKNILLTKDVKYDDVFMDNLYNQIGYSKFNCIVNVAGGWEPSSLDNKNLILSSINMYSSSMYSTILSAHLAKKYLQENSLVIFTGALAIKNLDQNTHNSCLGYQLAKESVHYFSNVLNNNKMLGNSKLITILPSNIVSIEEKVEQNKKGNYNVCAKEEIAKLINDWAERKIPLPEELFYKL